MSDDAPESADVNEPRAQASRGASPAPYRAPFAFLIVASVIALVLDVGTKLWAEGALETGDIVIIDGLMHFDLAHNPGGAFGLLGRRSLLERRIFFVGISIAAVVFIVLLYKKLEARQTALRWALPLVLGGALGNLFDRIRYGYVIDFIDVFAEIGGRTKHWPTFNVADIWIVVGVGLMAIDMFTSKPPAKADTSSPATVGGAPSGKEG
jgi:signal peptidase II